MTTTCCITAAAVSVRDCGPFVGARLFASLPVTLIAYFPPGVFTVVETVSVDVPPPPLMVTGLALKEHAGALAPDIAAQERVTLPVYPLPGVRVTVEVDVLPAVIEDGLKAVALRE